MGNIAIWMSIFISIFVSFAACFIPIILSESKAAQEKARTRRLADARMNARLLRFNL
jgi:cytochrome c biogenesis protein ResB